MNEFIFIWRVKNFSYSWHETGDWIESPEFIASSIQGTAWTIKLYPRGSRDSDYLSLELRREDKRDPESLAVNIEFSCVAADATTLHNCFIPESFTDFEGYDSESIPCFMQRQAVFGRRKYLYLQNDILTLRCRMWKNNGDANIFSESFGYTELETERIFFVVKADIENSVQRTFDIQSEHENETLMSISLLHCGDMIDMGIRKKKSMEFCTCNIILVDCKTNKKICEHEISFLNDPERNKWRLPFSDYDNLESHSCKFMTRLIFSTGEEINRIEEDCSHKISEFLFKYLDLNPLNILNVSKDLRLLFRTQVLCDVELQTKTKSIFAHRLVLCARSPVFLSMLTSEMIENKNGCIEIEDISANTMEMFLKFLYYDTIRDLSWNEMIELYCAANKYIVGRLKLLCCKYLLNNINLGNVCELLILADHYNDCELKRMVHAFIWENGAIFRSSMWKKFEDEQKDLASEVRRSQYQDVHLDRLKKYEELISSQPTIQDDLRFLFLGKIACDITIKTESASYPSYKTLLGASSSIFQDMLACKMTDSIEIKDLEDDTVSRLLFFLHTDSLGNMQWDTAKKLYHAAIVYKIRRLEFKCSCYLIENLETSNACELLLLADEHHDNMLKCVVEDYVCMYDEEIFGSDAWAALGSANFRLAFDTMCARFKKIE